MTRAVTLAEIAAEEVLTVDGTNSRIGIGSTQPTTKLDVDGTISADGIVTDSFGIGTTSPQSELTVRGSTPQITLEPTADTQDCRIQFATTDGTIQSSVRGGGSLDGDIKFVSGSSELVRIESGGNLGIGITNPTSRLHIKSSTPIIRLTPTGSGQTTRLTFTDENDSALNTIRGESGDLVFRGSSSEQMRLNSSGSLGIGTTSPAYKLTVAEGNTASISAKSKGDNTSSRAVRYLWSYDDGDGASINGVRTTGSSASDVYLSFRTGGITNSEERVRITSSGNFGIGTNNPTEKLHVVGDARITGILTVGTASITIDGDGGTVTATTFTGTATTATNLSDAANITTGTLADARIPSLNASKITAGTFSSARIPNLAASKITSGTLNVDITTSRVTDEIATSTAGTKGSYAFLGQTVDVARNPNYTVAGSSLLYANANGPESTSPGGSWRLMGKLGSGQDQEKASCWVRYA